MLNFKPFLLLKFVCGMPLICTSINRKCSLVIEHVQNFKNQIMVSAILSKRAFFKDTLYLSTIPLLLKKVKSRTRLCHYRVMFWHPSVRIVIQNQIINTICSFSFYLSVYILRIYSVKIWESVSTSLRVVWGGEGGAAVHYPLITMSWVVK